ncbi:MAG: SGNH/GDSL hydrolase family protein, partial [Nocardioides sp.]
MRALRLPAPGLVPAVAALGLAFSLMPAAAAPVVGAVGAESSSRQLPIFQEYVALGDSWTADVVVLDRDGLPATAHAPIDCGQSKRNYPKLVRAALGVTTFRDASCGSAKTDHFTRPQTGLPAGGTNPPQFDRLTRQTDLVTVGIGGNDAGIAGAGLDCLNLLPVANPLPTDQLPIPLGGCKAKYTGGGSDQLSQQIRASQPKLVRALKRIHRLSPKARILVVDYLSVVPDHGCYPTLPASDEDMRYFSAKFRELNSMLARAAHRGGAEIVKTRRLSVGHDLCTGPTVRYAETFGPSVNDPAVGVPAHPNAAGARAQAASVLSYLRRHPEAR